MPIYEYECSACKFYVEALQKMSEPSLTKCPSCKKSTLTRLMSAPAFRLKGGGWYETDFKSDQENKRNLAGREEPAEAKPAEKDVKSETKEAAKPAPAKSTERKAEPKKKPAAKPPVKVAARSAKVKPKPKPAKKAPAKAKKRR